MTVYTFTAPQTLARNSVTINAATMTEQTIAALLRGILEVEESDFEVSGVLAHIDALAEAISASDRAAMLALVPILDLTFTTGASAPDMERFGRFVYELMDATEWDSDTLQAIGDYATFTLKRPFSEPEA